MTKYKVILVGRRLAQIYELHYCIIFIISGAYGFSLHLKHLDIDSAFLNSYIDKQTYMRYEDAYEKIRICMLPKTLYDLKQAENIR